MACLLSSFFDKKKQKFDFRALQERRFACKKFSNEKISDEIVKEILFDANLSPSSFGLEPWHFYVLSKKEDKEEFSKICFNQAHVKDCSHVIVLCARIDLKSEDEFLKQNIKRKQSDEDKFKAILEKFGRNFDAMSQDELYNYASLQCYLACANLVNSAISKDIDSCIIGGFDKKIADEFLGLNQNTKSVLVITLGKKDSQIKEKSRRALDEVVTFK